MPFHWQISHVIEVERLVGIELDEVADEEIEMAVAVVIEESAARAPAAFLLVEAGLPRDIGKRSVAVVVEEDVVAPEGAEQVVPAVVVVVAHADAGLPAAATNAGFLRDIGECAVAVVFVEMGRRLFARRPVCVRGGCHW